MVVRTFQNKIPGFFQVFQVQNNKILGYPYTGMPNFDSWIVLDNKSLIAVLHNRSESTNCLTDKKVEYMFKENLDLDKSKIPGHF